MRIKAYIDGMQSAEKELREEAKPNKWSDPVPLSPYEEGYFAAVQSIREFVEMVEAQSKWESK
jgi:hypothetical protein